MRRQIVKAIPTHQHTQQEQRKRNKIEKVYSINNKYPHTACMFLQTRHKYIIELKLL